MGPLVRRSEGSHWYAKDGKPQHDATLREARKEFLYPSVTTVDKEVFKNPFLEKWLQDQILLAAGDNPRQPHENGKQYAQRIYDLSMEKSRAAMEFGKKVHDACEHYPEVAPEAEVKPWVDEFAKWWWQYKIEPVAREITLVDHDIGIAGRTDLIARIPDLTHSSFDRAVIDYKTQDVKVDEKGRKKPVFYDSWVRQLTFYGACDAKANGLWPTMPTCMNVIIDSNPGGITYVKVWDTQEVLDAYRTFVHGAWLWFDNRGYWPVGKWTPDLTKPMPL